MNKKNLFAIGLIAMSSQVYSEEQKTTDPISLEFESFNCTEDEVKEYIKTEKKDRVAGFKDFKAAYMESKEKEDEKKNGKKEAGSGPGGCATIFDTYKFPELPEGWDSLSGFDLTTLPGQIAQAVGAALEKGYCQVTSTEFYEDQKSKALEKFAEDHKLKEKGITSLRDPWLPQVMDAEITKHLKDAKVHDPEGLSAALQSKTGEKDGAVDDYSKSLTDDYLDKVFIEN